MCVWQEQAGQEGHAPSLLPRPHAAPTSRASALVMARSLEARALTSPASSVGLTPGEAVSSAVYDSTNASTLSATKNSAASLSGCTSRATCGVRGAGAWGLVSAGPGAMMLAPALRRLPEESTPITPHPPHAHLVWLGVLVEKGAQGGGVATQARHLSLGHRAQAAEQGGHIMSHRLLQQRLGQPAGGGGAWGLGVKGCGLRTASRGAGHGGLVGGAAQQAAGPARLRAHPFTRAHPPTPAPAVEGGGDHALKVAQKVLQRGQHALRQAAVPPLVAGAQVWEGRQRMSAGRWRVPRPAGRPPNTHPLHPPTHLTHLQ